ncbi:TonB-dependent receptor [Aliifodinibius sp. S!AR15-10]|uniref:TonB-dependent receptor n=1 Tax=Aliifodinibius sp. S!AR15-10 TaxID=2950437 RepID=UPI002854E321|nr:TonB-dependent receptor [Aliifodinibius sp. S!AR15-10]MDR8390173.1 TonB-dependent receptor [Aliifodinibius sp. S!AR15-10]
MKSIFTGIVIWSLLTSISFAQQSVPTQTVMGTVVDAVTQEPLPGANVVIADSDPLIGTSTDSQGKFQLAKVPLGRHDVKITFLGYQPAIKSAVLVTTGNQTVLNIELHEQVFSSGEVVVTPELEKDKPLNDMAFASSRSFTVEETRRYAGGLDDPGRMATAFAGVTSAGGVQDNALVIRGNTPKSVQWRLEGVEISNPNHFAGLSVAGGGGLTLFSGQVVSNSDFMTGAFPAQYGNALSGVFDINFRSGNPIEREHAAQIGVNGLEIASEGPFNEATYLFNYRYSTLSLLMPLLPTEGGIRYQDLSFKLDLQTENAGRFEFWGLGGLDGQEMMPNRDKEEWEYEAWDRIRSEMNLGVGAVGLSHRILLGEGTYLNSTLAGTVNDTYLDQNRLDEQVELQPNLRIDNRSGSLVAGSYLNHQFGRQHVNRTGLKVHHLFYDLQVQVAPNDEPPLVAYSKGNGSSQLIEAYTQSRFSISPSLTMHGGIHIQWFTLTDELTVEPRAGLEWNLTGKSGISLGYGLHSQMEDLRIYFVRSQNELQNRSLQFAKAHHFVLGYNRSLGENSRLKVELFGQELYDVPVIPDSSYSMLNFVQQWDFNESLVNSGVGQNYGVELTLERFLGDGYYYLFTGTLYNSRYKGGDGQWRNTRFDQGFAANALFGREFMLNDGRNVLGVNTRFSYLGGERHSPVDHVESQAREEVVYDQENAFSQQFDNRFIVDLTITYRINRPGHSSVWALQVKNLLLEKDPSFDYNLKKNSVDLIQEGSPLPLLSYKIEF